MHRSIAAFFAALFLLMSIAGCSRPLSEPFAAPGIVALLADAAPEGWSLADRRSDSIPWGHHEEGYGGEFLVLVGPEPVDFLWQDRTGEWHQEPLSRETLELWVMPGSYRPSFRTDLEHHRPVPAELVYSSPDLRVYARASHRITATDRFEELLDQAVSTGWSDIAGRRLSWARWRQEIAGQLEGR